MALATVIEPVFSAPTTLKSLEDSHGYASITLQADPVGLVAAEDAAPTAVIGVGPARRPMTRAPATGIRASPVYSLVLPTLWTLLT